MTFAELVSQVEHTKSQLDTSKTPYHKVEVKVTTGTAGKGAPGLDLYPGPLTKSGEVTQLVFEAE